MLAIKIEDGVPLPTRTHKGAKYPWNDLEVGQSFAVIDPPKWFHTTVSAEGRKRGKKFTVRQIDGGARVWRIA